MNDLAKQFDATWLRFRAAVDELSEAQIYRPPFWVVFLLQDLGVMWSITAFGSVVAAARASPSDDLVAEAGGLVARGQAGARR